MNSIRTRLLSAFLLIALLPLVVISFITYTTFNTALRQQVTTNLQAVANTKVRQIENYALERKSDVSALARTPELATIVTTLDQALTNDGPTSAHYAAVLAANSALFGFYTDGGGYADVYVLNADGRVLYVDQHREQIGQDYTSRDRIQTQLAVVFDRARTLIDAEISDFDYTMNPGQPTAFIAAPIISQGVIIGVVALQLKDDDLYRVVTDPSGLGTTGETVVGNMEGAYIRLAAPLRMDPGTPNQLVIPTSFSNLMRAVQGAHGDGQGPDYRHVEVLYVTRYVPSLRWGLVVKMDITEAFAPIQTVATDMTLILLLTLASVLLLGVIVIRTITQPLLRLNRTVRLFSQGDLSVRTDQFTGKDEVGELAHGFNELAAQLSTTISTLEDRVHYRTRALEMQTLSLREANAAAETANKAKSIFLANMSHELRTPLNAILGFTQLIDRESSLNTRLREYLSIILRSGDHLLSLINDVLEMSRIEAGQTVIALSSFDLHALLQNIDDLFRLRAQSEGLQFLIEHTTEVPRYITTDESKLRQILINLIGNALKFTHEGGIAVRVGLQPKSLEELDDSGEPQQYLAFEVEDTGEGISEADQNKLFRAFIQTESGIKSGQGTGLGLVLTRQFVGLLGGQISLRSQPGKGSIFMFNIAYSPTEAADSPVRKISPRVTGIDAPPGTVYRILVADDKWENRRLMVEWMKSVGFEVREAENGKEALAVWDEWNPHLIWMDMRMPVMDGYEATRAIKATIKGQATVVIALTASAFEHERDIVLSAGCDDFVRKPARESLIFAKIEQHLGITFTYDSAESASSMVRPEMTQGLTTAALKALPVEQRTALRDAAEAVDTEAALAVANSIRTANPTLANHLIELINTYRFDQIQSLLDENP